MGSVRAEAHATAAVAQPLQVWVVTDADGVILGAGAGHAEDERDPRALAIHQAFPDPELSEVRHALWLMIRGDGADEFRAFGFTLSRVAIAGEALTDDADRWRTFIRNAPARQPVMMGSECSRYTLTLQGRLTIAEWVDAVRRGTPVTGARRT
jgi:hypothetical protein